VRFYCSVLSNVSIGHAIGHVLFFGALLSEKRNLVLPAPRLYHVFLVILRGEKLCVGHPDEGHSSLRIRC
jgi:hypothetical protein